MRYCFDSDIIIYNLLRRKKKGHKWPKLKIISAPKAENKKKMAQICCYCLVHSPLPASALLKRGPG